MGWGTWLGRMPFSTSQWFLNPYSGHFFICASLLNVPTEPALPFGCQGTKLKVTDRRRFRAVLVIGWSEQHADGSNWLGIYDLLLVFYSDLRSVWVQPLSSCKPKSIIPNTNNNNKKSQSRPNLGRAASSPLTAENNYATKSPLVINLQLDVPHLPPKLLLPIRLSPPHLNDLIHPSLDRPHSPP